MSRGVKKASVRDLSNYDLTPEDIDAWAEELTGASPRACALVGGAYLANLLQRLIRTKLIALDKIGTSHVFDPPGPAADFHARIELAWALGLIDASTRRDLKIIKDVRNAFGHAPQKLTFEDTFVRKECSKLTGAANAGIDMRAAFVSRVLAIGYDCTHQITRSHRLSIQRSKYQILKSSKSR